jgi:hypothetical protein
MKMLVSCVLLLSSLVARAESPFDGTWIAKADTAVLDKKPFTLLLASGTWQNQGAVPPVKVKADGTDQPVSGHAYYDTLAVRVLGPDSVEVTSKKAGKVAYVSVYSVSSDGKTLTRKWTDTTGTEPATGEILSSRLAKGPAGSSAVSGSWRPEKMQNQSANGQTVTYKSTADGLNMSTPTGQSYEAKFDGKFYPIAGDPGGTTVSLQRVNANTLVETDKRGGKVVEVDRMTVVAGGKSIKVEWDDKEAHRKGSYQMEKSP